MIQRFWAQNYKKPLKKRVNSVFKSIENYLKNQK